MKHRKKTLALFIIAGFVLMAGVCRAQHGEHAERTLSPYFFVKSDDPTVDQLPLKSTSVKVDVAGVIADVTVTQVYKNEGKKPLEAIYIFPASTRAAVYGMKMTIGERIITAKIRKRDEARREYEQAKQDGKSASLLEQHRPNVFQMSVANILPSDIIKVELKYTELLAPTDTIYEFVYPTVVGPRYSNQPAAGSLPSDQWVENPYLHEGEPSPYTFDATVNIATGSPIQDVTCPSHKVTINYDGPSFAAVKLDPAEKHGGNRDFVVKYRLAGGKIESGLLLFEGEKENFFLLMVQPPERVTDSQIPPREYIFIVDVSGSMHGFPLKISKKLLKDLIGNLRPTDRFNVLLFAGRSFLMSEQSVPATPKNIRQAINVIEKQRGGGGTELLPALKRALSLPRPEGYSRSIVIATDGYVTVEIEAFDLIRNNLGEANMFTFGIGSSVNRYIIEGMARVGMGEPFIITKPGEAQERAEKFRKLIQTPVLTRVGVNFGRFEVYDVEPPSIPDVLADRPVIVFGKWRGLPRGTIHVQGITGTRSFMRNIDVSTAELLKTNGALRYLWARHRIALLSDYNRLRPNDERVEEVTDLGLRYNLLTAYTSFVAIDNVVRLKDGQATTIRQPLPLPQGVSDLAVGRGSFAQKAGSRAAPSTNWMGIKGMMKESCGEHRKDKQVISDEELLEPALERIHVELRKITVTQGLSKKAVHRLLTQHIHSIKLCLKQALDKGSFLKGKVVLCFVIDPAGRVTKMRVVESQVKNRELEHCMVQKLGALLFPAPEGGKKVTVTATFSFT